MTMKELVEAVARATEGVDDHTVTEVDGLILMRSNRERMPNGVLYRPALCMVLQGRKTSAFGDRVLECGPGEGLLVGIDTPSIGRVVQASPTEPYLGLVLGLDMATLREVMEEIEIPPAPDESSPAGVFRVDFGPPILDCLRRMVTLLDTPRAIPMLAPAIMREICYWLLTGPNGGEVSRVARLSGPSRAVVDTLRVLRERFAEPLSVAELARAAHLSPSAYHLRFKALTATSPLQYQKQLRLHEARRLLISGEENVESAAFRVGYVSPSQFSREYSRAFGLSPKRDAVARRASA